MKTIFLLGMLLAIGMCTFTTSTQCSCTQLLSQGDCIKQQQPLRCVWDATKSVCSNDTTTPVTPTISYATYCEKFTSTDCPSTDGCQWVSTKCSHYTGCTAFQKTTDSDCQAVSNKCITDGTHCVEKGTCSSYLKQAPCVVSASGSLCYWDTAATPNVCIDATKCEHLPISYQTDADCRAQISICTAKTGGGCQDSGTNCSDQTSQLQCVWNKLKSQSCFWNGTACVDRTCVNALTTYSTDDACKNYLTSCTTKSGGGCVTRAACNVATNQESCKTNSSGNLCYWNSSNACVDKNCAAAPTTYTTNKQCSDFVTGCITKLNGGCKSNGACSVADVQAACVSNSSSGLCIWNSNNQCVDKTCANAPSSNNTHDLCTTFISSCTVNAAANGCRTRTCDNASADYDTNDKCNTYLTGCITKTGGGCVANSTCAAVGSLEKACVKDSSGTDCIFDTICKDKICTNAPSSNTTHALCQTYMSSCTVNSSSNGCIDMTCENIQSSENCSKDKSSNVCVWKDSCYKKQCKQASIAFTSYSECTGFMNSCTVDNDGAGCMQKPPQCSGILTSAGCVTNSAGGFCAWSANKCIDRTCATAPSTTTTTADCNTYKSGCIVNNTSNGCIDPTTTACSARTLEDNCSASTGPVCLRDPTQSTTCIAKSCATASQTTITTTNGFIASPTPGFSNNTCGAYLTGCIINNGSNGCIAKESACSSYTIQANCEKGLASGGLCYWNTTDSTCVDKQCSKIKQATHSLCQTALNTCTYGDGTVCASKQTTCSGYSQNQCIVTSGGSNCIWANSAYRDATCADAENSSNYITHTQCHDFVSSCTVLDRVSNTGCVSLSTNCSDYTTQNQCYLDSTGGECFWNFDSCILKSTLTCATIKLATYSTGSCIALKSTCKANDANDACVNITSCATLDSNCTDYDTSCIATADSTACFTKPALCTSAADQNHCVTAEEGDCSYSGGCAVKPGAVVAIDCTLKTGTDLTYKNCKDYSSTCSPTLTGLACIKEVATCNIYVAQVNCRMSAAGACNWQGTQCYPMDTVKCADIQGSGLTYTICQDFSSTCSVNAAGSACVDKSANCSTESQTNCFKSTDYSCFWSNAACTPIMKGDHCALVIQASLNDSKCQFYHSSCYSNSSSSACYAKQSTCAGHIIQANCISTTTDKKCYWYAPSGGTAGCVEIVTAGTDCLKVTGTSLTDTICGKYNTGCSANAGGTACIEHKASCSDYVSSANCGSSTQGKCVWYSNACVYISSSSDCSKVTGVGLTFDSCQAYNTACSVHTGGTSCEAKSCTNKPASGGYAASECETYLSTCTSNSIATPTACQSVSATCNGSTTQDTCIRATEGDCVWIAGAVSNTGICGLKTCSTATQNTSFDTHNKCNAYLDSCTVARAGGCRSTGACNTYKSQSQCSSFDTCFWNARLNYGCVDKQCDRIEAAYNTHTLCSGTNIGCTVKANTQGCTAYTACTSYTIQDQCHVNASSKNCVWVTIDSTSTCQQKSCTTAETTNTTHQQCYDYFQNESELDSEMCTVAIVDVNGTPTPQGCQQVTLCASYTNEANCKIDNAGDECVWNSTSNTCAAKSCATAPATDSYDTDAECRAYLTDHSCTVDASGTGCVVRPDKCDGMTQAQCVTNHDGSNCEWFGEKCVDKVCETAPSDVITADACNTYLTGCTMEPLIKCKTQICEDFVFTTDSDCQKAKAGCTSNGTNCVSRSVCQAAVEAGCVTQSDGKQCQWVSSSSICVIKTCLTAPTTTDYSTESQCAAYFTGCTTKSGNGCTTKTTCATANVEAACTTASDGTKCVWDATRCRNIDCQDYAGTTYSECQAKSTNCTAGLNGKCIQLSNCEAVVTRAACVHGLNGPCLWIAGYNSGAGSCFSHSSCRSRTWTSDSECKWISDQCTTNGTNCLAIKNCAETNTQGGCKTGYDGSCIQTVASLGSTDPAICKVYNACSDAYYTTHLECQTASVKCTTNGLTSCVPLGACSTYTIQEACKINDKAGPTVDATTRAVTVTGVCKWDTTSAAAICRDQICSDLTGLTHQACYVQLSTCTSDGTNCLTKGACSSYTTQAACDIGYGSDGPQGECFWEAASASNNNTANCRVMKCSDIQNGTTTTVCQASLTSCVSDATVCITQDKCSTYKTQTSCNSNGTDGICVFAVSTATGATAGSGTCSLMNSCGSANADSNACAQAKLKCSWTPSSGSGTTAVASKCSTHTCATFAATNPTSGCTSFFSWDKQTQQVCTTVKGICTETDPSTLTVDSCYTISSYTYTWATNTNKCSLCTTTTVVNNTTNTNSTNTTTDSGYIIGLTSILIGYLMF